MKQSKSPGLMKRLIRKVKKRLSKKASMDKPQVTPIAYKQDSCDSCMATTNDLDSRLTACCHSNPPASKFLATCKAATLPSHSGSYSSSASQSSFSTCGIYSTCAIKPTTARFFRQNTSILSEDSGLCVEGELCCVEDEGEYNDVFTDCDEYSDDEGVYVVEDDGWWIEGEQISLGKVLVSSACETVYSGYWHGNVEVHARRSSDSELRASVVADLNMLTSIRHENIQLFLGVCDDLHSDHLSIVMDQLKGHSLHNLLYKQDKQFNCQAVNKIANQIAQGVDYLHAKGISHPLLTSKSVTLHYRVCISMLPHYSASSGNVQSDDLVYLPPETIRTASLPSTHRRAVSSSVSLEVDSSTLQTSEANVFSFGTLMYELLAMEKPYSGIPANSLILQVGGNDRVFPLGGLPGGKYKQMIKKCWRSTPEKRPTFAELLRTLEHNASPRACGLKSTSQFSFSEPKRLDKLGL